MPIIPSNKPPYYTTSNSIPGRSITLTNDDLKILNENPLELIPQPGQNTYILLTSLTAILHIVNFYTDVDASSTTLLIDDHEVGNIDLTNPLQELPGDWVIIFQPNNSESYNGNMINKPLTMTFNNSTNLTGGNDNNYLKIQLTYSIINITQ